MKHGLVVCSTLFMVSQYAGITPSSRVAPSWHAAELLKLVVAMEMQQLYVV